MKHNMMKIASPFVIALTKKILGNYYQGNMQLELLQNNEKILVFAPHIDDETIGLGGTLIRFKEFNAEVHVVFVTNGSKSNGSVKRDNISAQRVLEIETIRDDLGIFDISYLDYEDGEVYKQAKPADFLRFIEKVKPSLIFTTPFIDAHLDHVHTAHAVAEALKLSDHKPRSVFEYEINCPFPPENINCLVDISKEYNKKVELTKVFKSQVIAFDGFHLLALLKANLAEDSKVKAVEGFILSSPDMFVQKSAKLKNANLMRFDHVFKQVNRSVTLLWALFKNYKEKKRYYKLVQNKKKTKLQVDS
jgi:LmbE family N-acetylglucosaminyl deacetylase